MKFLKIIFWLAGLILLLLFTVRNWADVTVTLWGDLRADVKLPFLLVIVFLLGFLPPYFLMRGRVWALNRKLLVAQAPVAAAPLEEPAIGGTDE